MDKNDELVQYFFQVVLTYLVYEKQQKLKIMMKMHGLKDGPYWMITYTYFFALSAVYMLLFIIFGSVIGKSYFENHQEVSFIYVI